ncbi:MAG: 23S rRNA (guanosine(2251)-2'-O)-methyltransferase RlmB [Gammaproteobacteria bacterium]|jgi:23S rRNA (guanosine2251-2'-O)-methyltransferase
MKNFIHGIHAIEAALTKSRSNIQEIFMQQGRHDKRAQKILQLAKKHKVSVSFVSSAELQNLVKDARHQGIVAQIQVVEKTSENDLDELLAELAEPAFLLILDGVQDPHNLGACLRSAEAAGVHAVIAPKDRAVGLTSTVCKVASGATETVPFIQVTNLARTMRKLKDQGIWLMGADERGEESLFNVDLSGSIAVVMGAEGKGLRRLTKEHCDQLLHIPMAGSVASLNVSVATGIFLFEVVRQRFTTDLS